MYRCMQMPHKITKTPASGKETLKTSYNMIVLWIARPTKCGCLNQLDRIDHSWLVFGEDWIKPEWGQIGGDPLERCSTSAFYSPNECGDLTYTMP